MNTRNAAQQGPLHISQLRRAFLEKFQLELGAQKSKKEEVFPKSKKHKKLTDPETILIQCRKKWAELNPDLHKHSYPASIKGDTLIVYLSHFTYLTDFQFQKQAVEKKIQILSCGEIKTLALRYSKEHNFSA